MSARRDDTGAGERIVPVPVAGRAYAVRVGAGILGALGERMTGVGLGGRAFVIHDAALPEGTVQRVVDSVRGAGFDVGCCPMTASEGVKTLPTLERLLKAIAATRHERSDPIVALGGGVVGDVVGFAAACYRRGVPVVQCPTTLLAMVDASIGGKTGVNLRIPGEAGVRKNFVGAFHQPSLVVADVAALDSLPARHLRSGLAECVKHALVCGDERMLRQLEATADPVLAREAGALVELVAENVRVKAAVVCADEREESSEGGRALLNLGHTFAHAIETLADLTPDGDPASAPLHHGEAVALGLIAACVCGERLAGTGSDLTERVRGLLSRIGLPTSVAGLPGDDVILSAMGHDKKVRGGRVRLIVPESPGKARVIEDPPSEALARGIAAIRD